MMRRRREDAHDHQSVWQRRHALEVLPRGATSVSGDRLSEQHIGIIGNSAAGPLEMPERVRGTVVPRKCAQGAVHCATMASRCGFRDRVKRSMAYSQCGSQSRSAHASVDALDVDSGFGFVAQPSWLL